MKKNLNCTFPPETIGQPLLYNLSRDYRVVPNIRGASVTDDSGFLALELEGDEECIGRAIEYLRELGVNIEIVEECGESTN